MKWWSNSTENSSLNHDLPQSINAVKYSDESSWNSTGVSSIMNDGEPLKIAKTQLYTNIRIRSYLSAYL